MNMGPALAMHVDLLLLSSNLSELGFHSQNDGVHNENTGHSGLKQLRSGI